MGKKISIILIGLLLSLAGFSQSRFSVNLNGGLDKNFNKYYNAYGFSKIEDVGTDFNTGLNVAYRFTDWFRFRIDFKYVQYNYGQETTTLSEVASSELRAYHMAFNPRFDFRIWSKNKFEVFLSPGLSLEYLMGNDQISVLTDGTNSYKNYISTSYNDSMSGLIGGAVFKYNLTKHLGFTLAPDYTLFFDELYSQNDGNLQRFSTNIGVEWTF